MASCLTRGVDEECTELGYSEISTRKMSKRMQEPVDQWLAKEGYFRKPTPRDPTCLFRAISEQVYYTQYYHLRVRRECTAFMMRMRHLFEKFITVPFDHYLKEMQCFTEWGGPNEIRAMSLFYRRNIIIFVGEKQVCETVIRTGFKKGDILLCRTNTKQYESVYPISFVQTAAYCQSLVYEVVYKDIFKMPDITTVADKMLRNRNATFRHDRFFQKGNLGIREQLTVDLYNKIKSGSNDTDEVQCDWKGVPPIPYKVAKALAPDYYRNIELDIWCELKREVKSAGWSRFNSNELQVGGKCLIEISVNELEQFDRNNNSRIKSLDCDISDSNNKIVQQQLKQGLFRLCGYIQEISTDKEPVLVFIEDLGEKKLVPYSALKPFPITKRNKQKNWTPMNRNHAVNTDSSRRWRKTTTSFTRKKKDTIMPNVTPNNANKNVLINDINDDNINNVDNNNIDAIKIVSDIDNDKLSKDDLYPISENETENGSKLATNEETNNLPVAITFENLQSNNMQEIVEEHKKADAVFRNKSIRSKEVKNLDHDVQNSVSKQKTDDNYASYNSNSQINMNSNANVLYITPDGFYPYISGNFGDHNTNQMDHSLTSRFFYNLHLLHLEDTFRTLNPAYYASMPYGQSQNVQTLGAPTNSHTNNNVSSTEENMDCLISEIQNCSLYDGTAINGEISKTSGTNDAQGGKQLKQGSSKSNEKDSYQMTQKTKQPGTIKNKLRNRLQSFRGAPTYMQQHFQQSYNTNMLNNLANPYDARRHDMYTVPSQHHLDSSVTWTPHQTAGPTAPNSSGTYMPQYASAVYSAIPYHDLLPPQCTSEGNMYYSGNFPWNPNYMSVPCLPSQHVESTIENAAAIPSYPQHTYSMTETYPSANSSPGYPQTANQSMVYPQPMMYPPPIQYHALPSSPLPMSHMQEQWNSCMGQQSYVQYGTPSSQTIAEASSGVQNIIPQNVIP